MLKHAYQLGVAQAYLDAGVDPEWVKEAFWGAAAGKALGSGIKALGSGVGKAGKTMFTATRKGMREAATKGAKGTESLRAGVSKGGLGSGADKAKKTMYATGQKGTQEAAAGAGKTKALLAGLREGGRAAKGQLGQNWKGMDALQKKMVGGLGVAGVGGTGYALG